MSYNALLDNLEGLNQRLKRGPISDRSFSQAFHLELEQALELGVWVKASVSDSHGVSINEYEAGTVPSGRSIDSKNLDKGAAHLKVEHCRTAICKLEIDQVDNMVASFSNLVLTHWGPRDQGTLLPRLADAGEEARILQSIQEMIGRATFFAVLHTDLDKFKLVNTEFGETAGNKVIRAFANRMREELSDFGLVVRTGGEEFSAFLVSDDPTDFFTRADRLRRRMESENLPEIQRPNTCSIGLAVYKVSTLPANLGSIDEVLTQARNAEMRAKEKGRNRICLPESEVPNSTSISKANALGELRRSALASRMKLDEVATSAFGTPFANALQSLLSAKLSEPGLKFETLAITISKFVDSIDVTPHPLPWSALESSSPIDVQSGWPQPFVSAIPTVVWGAIVAQSLLSSTFRSAKLLSPKDELEFKLVALDAETSSKDRSNLVLEIRGSENVVNISLGPFPHKPTPHVKVCVGRPWYPSDSRPEGGIIRAIAHQDDTSATYYEYLSPCILMPIGDSAIRAVKVVSQYVAAVVEIDDRPVFGGGLPDFWQSNLGRVVRVCLQNANIQKIIAVGNETGAAQTIGMLKLSKLEWTGRLHELQRRLSIGAHLLQAFRERDIEFEIVPENAIDRDMLKTVVDSISSKNLRTPDQAQNINFDRERQARRLAVPAATVSNQLSITDGFRCKSLADAYPQAIQLLRSSDEAAQTEPNRRSFREFPCFKLVLTDPFQDEIPDYWADEDKSLKDYIIKNFTSPDGLFGKRLIKTLSDGQNVRDFGIEALVLAIKERRPTRRITLPVATGDVQLDQPLGLVMVQIMPRYREGRWHIDFQWIWRTVEALVGFPFSAIGSIRWSRDFFNSAKQRLRENDDLTPIELGQLTYLALSFHMFLDLGDLEIARAIVQDASR